ncbi:MAG: glycosyltransferase family 4 protein [Rubrobacter sp.]|nr:glycosyltransferase family 4 protein [Rubrobacter sp.]
MAGTAPRIAYVCMDPGVPVFGRKGNSIHVQEVVRALVRRGARVELFTPRPGGDPDPELAAVPVHRLPALPKGDLAAREGSALAANIELRAALEREGPFDAVYERYALWSFAGMEHALDAGVPGLLEVNAPLVEEQAAHRGLVDRAGAEDVAEKVFGAATLLFAVSGGVAEYLERYPAARGRVQVVPNGVDPGRFPEGLEPSRPSGTFTVGFVGTLKPWHGLAELVEAFGRLHRRAPEARLLVVGDGPERAGLENELAARGLSGAAHLTGSVASAEVPGLLASMDVAVAPYPGERDFYFSPLKIYEYLAAGLPVVASRVGQLEDVIRDGENGLLCPAGDPGALAAALDELRRDRGLRSRLGRRGRETVLRDHTWDAVAQRILQLPGGKPASRTNYEGVG